MFDKENFLPQSPVGVNAKKSLTEGDKDRKVENGIWN
jgi:hypothetical protein